MQIKILAKRSKKFFRNNFSHDTTLDFDLVKNFLNACKYGDHEAVELYLTKEPKLCDIAFYGSIVTKDPLYNASENGHIDVVKILLRHMNDNREQVNESFIIAVKNNHFELVCLFLKNKYCQPSYRNNRAFSAACFHGHIKIVEVLLNDLRVNPRDNQDLALVWAAANGHKEVVILLIEKAHANPSARNNRAFIEACRNQYFEIIRILLNNDTVVESVDLKSAFKFACPDIVNLILCNKRFDEKYNANVALFYSCLRNNSQAVKILLEKKHANAFAIFQYSKSPTEKYRCSPFELALMDILPGRVVNPDMMQYFLPQLHETLAMNSQFKNDFYNLLVEEKKEDKTLLELHHEGVFKNSLSVYKKFMLFSQAKQLNDDVDSKIKRDYISAEMGRRI